MSSPCRYESIGLRLNIDIPDLLLKLTITILAPSIVGKVRAMGWAAGDG